MIITLELEMSLPTKRLWPTELRPKWWLSAQWFRGRPHPIFWNRKAFVRVLGVALIVGVQWKLKEEAR